MFSLFSKLDVAAFLVIAGMIAGPWLLAPRYDPSQGIVDTGRRLNFVPDAVREAVNARPLAVPTPRAADESGREARSAP